MSAATLSVGGERTTGESVRTQNGKICFIQIKHCQQLRFNKCRLLFLKLWLRFHWPILSKAL
jgi:hypothetical protein